MLHALAQSTPASVFAPKKNFAVEYKKLAASIIGEEYNDKRVMKRMMNFLAPDASAQAVNRAVLTEESKKK